jgi:hypothetical protein
MRISSQLIRSIALEQEKAAGQGIAAKRVGEVSLS